VFKRFKEPRYLNYPNYSVIGKWVFIILILVIISIIWIFYFISEEYIGISSNKIYGTIFYKDNPAINVRIEVDGEEVVTDENGEFVISNVSLGRKTIKISKEHYFPINKKVFVWRKNIKLKPINIDRDPEYTAYFSGLVYDNFSKKPIEGAIVYLNDSVEVTDNNGRFEFEDISTGGAQLKISALDFEDIEENIVLERYSFGAKEEKEFFLSPYGKISFTSTREGIKNIYTINYDGTNIRNLTIGHDEDCWGASFTPDGERLIFYSYLDKERNQWGQKIAYLYSVNKEGRGIQRITREEEIYPEGDYIISDDSQRVIFSGKEKGRNIPEIFLAGIGNNKEWRQLTENDFYETILDISPDGRKILYSAFREGARDIYMIDTVTYKEKRITSNTDYESFASFSPDGREILYVSEGYDFSSRMFIYNILTEEEETISSESIEGELSEEDKEETKDEEIYKTSLDLRNVMWSNDGKEILFASTRDNKTNIFIINSDGSNEIKVTKESNDFRNIIWPSIKKVLVFTIHSSSGDVLAVLNLSSREIFEIEEVADDIISWSDR